LLYPLFLFSYLVQNQLTAFENAGIEGLSSLQNLCVVAHFDSSSLYSPPPPPNRSLSFNKLTQITANLSALAGLSSLLLSNNSIELVDPSIWPNLVMELSLLDMTGNPSQCSAGISYSDNPLFVIICECAPGFVGATYNGAPYASGCVPRKQTAFFPPAVAVAGVTYVFNALNASRVAQQLCTNQPCCNATAIESSSAVALQVSGFCYISPEWYVNSVASDAVFFPSVSYAQLFVLGTPNLPQIASQSMDLQLYTNQFHEQAIANNVFAPNMEFPAQIRFQLGGSALPQGLHFDPVGGVLFGLPLQPAAPVEILLFETNVILNFSSLLTVLRLSISECNTITCSGGTCDYQGSPYDGSYSCSGCPSGLTGRYCHLVDPFVDSTNANAAITVSLFSVLVVLALVIWYSRARDVAKSLSSRLQDTEAEMGAMRRMWQIPASELEIEGDIASGSFGRVVRALWNDIPVAVKYLPSSLCSFDEIAAADFERECAFMKSVRHPNIVLFFGAGQFDGGTPFLVLELLERGSLREVLENSPSIEWVQKLVFARDTAVGMQHLHTLGCIHRDLKSGNLLITQNFHVKVADFGTSRLAERLQQQENSLSSSKQQQPQQQQQQKQEQEQAKRQKQKDPSPRRQLQQRRSHSLRTKTMTKMVGTPLWMAPEVLEGKKSYDNKIDVYAYGIVLFEILTQTMPWMEIPEVHYMRELTAAVLAGRRPIIPPGTPCPDDAYLHLMEKCWAQQPKERPSFAEVVVDHVFASYPVSAAPRASQAVP
jgi:serine/threonine protein kinase